MYVFFSQLLMELLMSLLPQRPQLTHAKYSRPNPRPRRREILRGMVYKCRRLFQTFSATCVLLMVMEMAAADATIVAALVAGERLLARVCQQI
jgi:hypothetical protein